MRREDGTPLSEPPTAPPTDAELEALAHFELVIQQASEADARYVHTSECLDELLHPAAQPDGCP